MEKRLGDYLFRHLLNFFFVSQGILLKRAFEYLINSIIFYFKNIFFLTHTMGEYNKADVKMCLQKNLHKLSRIVILLPIFITHFICHTLVIYLYDALSHNVFLSYTI